MSVDGASFFYGWNARSGNWVIPLCFTSEPAWRRNWLRLDFGPDGRLLRYRLRSKLEGVMIINYMEPFPPKSPGVYERDDPFFRSDAPGK